MDTLISQLDQKYEKYQQNLINNHNGDLDEDIFYIVYDYLCITEKQPKIREIIEKDRKDTEIKIKKIIQQNDSKEVQRDLRKRIENNSLSFCYDQIFRDVYVPRNKVQNSAILLSPDEIIGETKIHWKEFWDTIYFILKGIARFFTDRKDLSMNITLQQIIHSFASQKKYSMYFETIHTALKPQLLEIHTQNKEPLDKKISIILDNRKGIYQEDNDQKAYGIGKGTKRFKLIKFLKTKECKISILADYLHQENQAIMTSILDINRLFREKAEQSFDLILHNDTIGYFLNTDKFEIKMKE